MITLDLPPEAEAYRAEVRAWADEHPAPSGRELAEAGLVAPHWPSPWGRDAAPLEQLAIDQVLRERGIRRPSNPIGIGWAGPTILHAGTQDQADRYLMDALSGEVIWCQLFSEPGAGSDLAGLRTRAERDGDVWVVNGQKIWTSLAQMARFGILLARTDPEAPKHAGITYFICPMDAPGVEVRPIKEMTGSATFNEVFLTDVRIPAENVVGEVHRGWDLAKVTLANERVSLSTGGAIWGMGPTADDLLDVVRDRGGIADPVMRQRMVGVWMESQVLDMLRARMVAAAMKGRTPGPEVSVRKHFADMHGQRLFNLARDLAGMDGLARTAGPLGVDDPIWTYGFEFAPALTIGGGTTEVQKGVIGERVLGLPREPDPNADVPFRELVP
jgi:alkylation response protein AidB-like acyl-CoA dehydrogenase